MEVNVTGVFLCSREFGKLLRERGGGAVVNLSSMNGKVAFPMRLVYCTSKAAVIMMTEVLAGEWAGYGIRVNAIARATPKRRCSGRSSIRGSSTSTPMFQHTQIGRFAEPEEIARSIVFLASERSSYVTGEVLVPSTVARPDSFGSDSWSGDPEAPELAR